MYACTQYLIFSVISTLTLSVGYDVSVVLLQMLYLVDGERREFVEVQIIEDVVVPERAERFQIILSRPSPGMEPGTYITLLENLAPPGLVRIGRTLNMSLLDITPHTTTTNLCRSTYCNLYVQYSSNETGM